MLIFFLNKLTKMKVLVISDFVAVREWFGCLTLWFLNHHPCPIILQAQRIRVVSGMIWKAFVPAGSPGPWDRVVATAPCPHLLDRTLSPV